MEEAKKPERQLKMLIGSPGSGKSFYVDKHAEEFKEYTVLSLDNIIKKRCAEVEAETGIHCSMDYILRCEKDKMTALFNKEFKEAIQRGDNILIDGANDDYKKRAIRINAAKQSQDFTYRATAIIIHPPEEDMHITRLFRRSMAEERFGAMNYVNRVKMEPVKDSEFDNIIHVGAPPEKPLLHEYRKPSEPLNKLIKDAEYLANGGWKR